MMFYIMTLLFSYRELFDYTPSDEPIILSQAEIKKLKESCERRKNAGVDTTKEPTVTTISFQPQSKRDAKKNEQVHLTDAQKKLQKEAIHSLN